MDTTTAESMCYPPRARRIEFADLPCRTPMSTVDADLAVAQELAVPVRAIIGYCRIIEADWGERLPRGALELLRRVSGNAQLLEASIDYVVAVSAASSAPPTRWIAASGEGSAIRRADADQ